MQFRLTLVSAGLTFNLKLIFLRIKNLKQNYLAKSPFKKWSFVCGINKSVARIIGCDFWEDDYEVTLRSLIPGTIILDYIISLMYTFYYFRNDPVRCLMATASMGIVLPASYMITLSLYI